MNTRIPDNTIEYADTIMTLRWDTATEDDIIRHCSRANPDRHVISELQGGLSIVKISEEAVVKCGTGVTLFEARNQQQAYEILRLTSVKIPKVYRFFSHGLNGYIIMECVNGQPISFVEDPDTYLEPMAKILKQFEYVQHNKPGPFHGQVAFGQLWIDTDLIAPTSITDIEEYYNKRQLKKRTHLKLTDFPLVFCHLDIAPRNILVLEDGSLCLIDWHSAGFYPRLFERIATKINIRENDDWNTKLLRHLDKLNEREEFQAGLLEHAYYLGQKFIYRTTHFKPQLPPDMIPPKKTKRMTV